jgi:hypothetical protein
VRFALALALVEAAGAADDEPPQGAVDLLLELAERPPAGLEEAYAKLGGSDAEGPIGANIGATLANAIASVEQRLGVAARLVPVISAHLAQEKTIDAFYDVATLLKLTQPRDAEEAEFDVMRKLRVRALEAICAMKDELWTWVNFREVLDGFGVPTAWTAEEGRAKLRQLAASDTPYAIPSDDDDDEEEEEDD